MDVAWVAANRKAYEAYEQGTPQFRLGLWRKMYQVPAIRFFPRQEEREVTWTLPTTVDRKAPSPALGPQSTIDAKLPPRGCGKSFHQELRGSSRSRRKRQTPKYDQG